MNTLNKIFVANILALSLCAITYTTIAAGAETGTTLFINNTITHLEAAQKAISSNDIEGAQEHMKAARQSAKDIIGGSIEVKTQRGTNAIASARRLSQKGDKAGASASLKDALEVFKSLQSSSETGSRGGLK